VGAIEAFAKICKVISPYRLQTKDAPLQASDIRGRWACSRLFRGSIAMVGGELILGPSQLIFLPSVLVAKLRTKRAEQLYTGLEYFKAVLNPADGVIELTIEKAMDTAVDLVKDRAEHVKSIASINELLQISLSDVYSVKSLPTGKMWLGKTFGQLSVQLSDKTHHEFAVGAIGAVSPWDLKHKVAYEDCLRVLSEATRAAARGGR